MNILSNIFFCLWQFLGVQFSLFLETLTFVISILDVTALVSVSCNKVLAFNQPK